MKSGAISPDRSVALLISVGLLSLGAEFLGRGNLVDPEAPFLGWLLSIVLLLAWVAIAIRTGFERLRPRWLVVVSGAMIAFAPLIGLLPGNHCLIFGACVY